VALQKKEVIKLKFIQKAAAEEGKIGGKKGHNTNNTPTHLAEK